MKSSNVRSLFSLTAGLVLSGLGMTQSARAQTLYAAQSDNTSTYTIQKYTPGLGWTLLSSSGAPVAGRASTIGGLAMDSAGNGMIKKFTPGGVASVFATTGVNQPGALAFDSAGNLFEALQGSAGIIDKITPGGVVSVFATHSGTFLNGLAFDSAGNLFASAENTSSSAGILKFTPGGVVSSFVGSAFPLWHIGGLAFDSGGNLFAVYDGLFTGGQFFTGFGTIERYTPTGAHSDFFASSNTLRNTGPVAFDSAGNLYVANGGHQSVDAFTPTGTRSVFASGTGTLTGMVFPGTTAPFVTTTPEPGTYTLLAAVGLTGIGVGLIARRRRAGLVASASVPTLLQIRFARGCHTR